MPLLTNAPIVAGQEEAQWFVLQGLATICSEATALGVFRRRRFTCLRKRLGMAGEKAELLALRLETNNC